MREAPEYLSIIQAAERAAEAGDYSSAEDLLRDAARLQEATLGPRHPDLANTLNNLGIVCEITGKPDDAEQYFRRAVSIARTSLAPDHPFVATSQKNLRDFCETRGRKVEQPAPAPKAQAPAPVVTADPAPAATAGPAPKAAPDPDPEDPEHTSKKLFVRLVLGALGPIAMLMVVLSIGLPKLGAPELAAPLREFAVEPPHAEPPEPAPPRETPAGEPPPEEVPAPAPAPVEASIARVATVSPPERLVVVRASLCGGLDDWLCDPADRPVPPGPLFFYTQVKSSAATTVQHRWYRDGRLFHSVELRVQANASAGYRTFSRQMMTNHSVGSWRVELRGGDGALLHEERFTVQ